MKRMMSFALVMVLGLVAVGLAQDSAKNTEKKQTSTPASTGHKATMEQKSMMTASESLQLNKNEITALQNALIKAQAYKGNANGMLDTATKSAIRKYQTDHKLKVTGEPNPETMHKLGVAYATPLSSSVIPQAEQVSHSKKDAEKKSQAETKKP